MWGCRTPGQGMGLGCRGWKQQKGFTQQGGSSGGSSSSVGPSGDWRAARPLALAWLLLWKAAEGLPVLAAQGHAKEPGRWAGQRQGEEEGAPSREGGSRTPGARPPSTNHTGLELLPTWSERAGALVASGTGAQPWAAGTVEESSHAHEAPGQRGTGRKRAPCRVAPTPPSFPLGSC